jgi:glycosyltransferase involved in cell wall biosynthesis
VIGAALIVRDEERCLARCLSSIRPIVDEIVVVDTGSRDRSVAIARDFGARVLHHRWTGDFAQARNFALDALTADHVLYIDADEWVLPGVSRADLDADLAEQCCAVAYRVLLRPRPGFTPYREYRMWVNRPDIRFRGLVHETIVSAIGEVVAAEGLRIGRVRLRLDHDGYESGHEVKRARYLPLLTAQLANDPTRTYLWDHIGRIRAELGEGQCAREAFDRGIEVVRRNGVQEPSDCLVFVDRIFGNAVHGTPDAALVAEALTYFPDNAPIRWAAALDALARGAYAEVTEHTDRLLSADPVDLAEAALSINERIVTEWAWHVRAMARFASGDFSGAAADFARAEAAAPQVVQYRAKRVVAAARAAAVAVPA